ncbi:MAG: hypothetical protein ABI895_43200, partial [Deltaproteobacteria bacterium]
ILYGRLDGACQLLETLLNPSWLRTALAVPDQRRRVLSAFGVLATEQQDNALARSSALRHWLDTEEIFPNAGKEATARAAEALAVLLDPEPSEFEPRIAGAAHAELLNALVEATHFSIVYDDYAKLIEDSIDEQLAWRSGKVGSSAPPDAAAPAAPTSVKSAPAARRPQFDPQTRAFDLTLDNLVVQAAAQQFAKDALAQRDTQALVTLLQKHPVGKESIQDDIPPSVLLELTAHTLLVLRNCILNSLGPRRSEAVRSQRIYRVFVDWPLRALYALANLIRERPAHGGIALGLLAYFLLAVIVDVCVFDSLWALAGWRGYVTSFALIALPLSCLAAAAGLVAASEYSWKSARSSYLLLARHILLWIVRVGAALAALVPIYIAYAYVAGWVSVALAGVLCRLPWFPGCNDSGSVVVLSTAAAVSFFVGKLTARRPLHSPASAAREEDDESSRNTTGGGDPPSSATGTRPLAVAAE